MAIAYNLRNISLARKQLTKDATRSLTEALVLSRLDYGNSLLSGVSKELLQKLQVLQNSAARLVTKLLGGHISLQCYVNCTGYLARIDFKVLYLVFKALHAEAPQYLSELIHTYVPPRSLRSQNKGMLTEPAYRSTNIGGGAFSNIVPRLWNSIIVEGNVPISTWII